MAQSREASNHAHRTAKRATAHAPRERAKRAPSHVARELRKSGERLSEGRERATQNGAGDAKRATQGGLEALRQQTERMKDTGHEEARQSRKTSAAAITSAARTNSASADATQEIVGVWAIYAQELLHNTSEARAALFRARSFSAMMQVQAELMRENLQAFLSHWSRLTHVATQLGLPPLEAFGKANAE
jgi:phasin protein